MKNFICNTCGVQSESLQSAPEVCSICKEERQYVSSNGQTWTTLEKMIQTGIYKNNISLEEQGLSSISTSPAFGIGQTAYLVQGKKFNLLWDCISYIDAETVTEIKKLGGIDAIALSHPHYYSTQVEWAEAFDAAIYIHEDDQEWVTRSSNKIVFWSGESLELAAGLILHRIGGHFKGATVLEWRKEEGEKGVLLTGDIVRVTADQQWVSFMYSYPNFIPLPGSTVERMASRLNEIEFARLYDAFNRVIIDHADKAVQHSAKRYMDAVNGVLFKT